MNTVIKIELSLSDNYKFDASESNPDLADTPEILEERAEAIARKLEKALQIWLDQPEQRKDFGVAYISECVGEVAEYCEEMAAAYEHRRMLNEREELA